MDKIFGQKVAGWTIVILLLMNIATLSTIWLKEFRQPDFVPSGMQGGRHDVSDFLKDELGLDESQIEKYNELRSNYLENSRVLMRNMQELKRGLIDQVFEDNPDQARAEQLTEKIGETQSRLEQLTFSYYKDLRELCGEERKEQLQGIMNGFFFRGLPGGQNWPPRRPGQMPGPPDAPKDMPLGDMQGMQGNPMEAPRGRPPGR